jgi:hypothetical protein
MYEFNPNYTVAPYFIAVVAGPQKVWVPDLDPRPKGPDPVGPKSRSHLY